MPDWPTDLFSTLELQIPSPDIPELHEIRRSSDLEAPKFWQNLLGDWCPKVYGTMSMHIECPSVVCSLCLGLNCSRPALLSYFFFAFLLQGTAIPPADPRPDQQPQSWRLVRDPVVTPSSTWPLLLPVERPEWPRGGKFSRDKVSSSCLAEPPAEGSPPRRSSNHKRS